MHMASRVAGCSTKILYTDKVTNSNHILHGLSLVNADKELGGIVSEGGPPGCGRAQEPGRMGAGDFATISPRRVSRL